ncbi:MAG: 2-oxo acid dehydrogenase subunit E2 [Deltaproteobacteria bacterium]|nr:2-oxo acid dehydrogenase subunit E2 [Deltaproteobacteria bacterium]MCW8893538.1 2-oxo acid dehydrogenase subunit E2 [Deltaproteobacteria bacterium]MCW9048949.1 2-oxo acid dehydrogenase subunit E2 [Deltaproteobacteria bacterium]
MVDKNATNKSSTVSAAARKLAQELGIDLKSLRGSGAQGRILLADVEQAQSGSMRNKKSNTSYQQKVSLEASIDRVQSVKVRRLLARKMEEAWKAIPHFYVTIAVDMTDVVRIRHEHEATINDFILAATARALIEHPWVNATWDGEQGIELAEVNIAIAAATDRGLYFPVVHNCQELSLAQISQRAAQLADKAANNAQLTEHEMSAGTFTITNMGMLGVESFGAIITPPQAAVLSVGSVKGEVIVDEQGEPTVALMMRLTLSADHRVLDGADAAEFLATVKSYLEAPVMLVDD